MQTNFTLPEPLASSWRKIVAEYTSPDVRKAVWQIITSVGPYLLLFALMVWTSHISYWITLALAVPAALFMVRVFIIFHDCGHGSFFASQKANRAIGYLTGILTFTPYESWAHDHAIHHATAGDLDRRGVGDVPTMTVEEFVAAPRWQRWGYAFIRHPLVLFGFGQLYIFLFSHRFTRPGMGKRERQSIIITNLALLAILAITSLTIGWKTYLLVQLPIIWIGGAIGEWMFYVQHQFEGVYWARHKEWDYVKSAVLGASFYKLPRLLQWFSGNIGFHHIHHLSPRIPNYNLEKCHRENPIFNIAPTVTLLTSLRSLRLRLWDESARRLIGFRELRMAALKR